MSDDSIAYTQPPKLTRNFNFGEENQQFNTVTIQKYRVLEGAELQNSQKWKVVMNKIIKT